MAMPRPTLITYGATPTRSVAGSISRRRTYIAATPKEAAVASAVHARGRGSRASSTTIGSNPTTVPIAGTTNHTPAQIPTATAPGRSHSEQTVATAADTTPPNSSERRT